MPRTSKPHAAMPLVAALEVLRELRHDQIVISSMGTAREWIHLSHHPFDLNYVPSAMGQAPILGLGLALAQPARQVIALCGDGSLLMNLGCLVTIAAAGASNLAVILFDNGVYEVTGRQRTAASAQLESGRRVDWLGLARSAGIAQVAEFAELDDWRSSAVAILREPGPQFIVLRVEPVEGDASVVSPGPMPARLAAFRAALGV